MAANLLRPFAVKTIPVEHSETYEYVVVILNELKRSTALRNRDSYAKHFLLGETHLEIAAYSICSAPFASDRSSEMISHFSCSG